MNSEKEINEAHLLNYRIAFDAMRAYHNSQIENKKDIISILNNIFISIITVFAGIFYFVITDIYIPYNKVAMIIIPCITAFYIVLIHKLKMNSTQQIIADNYRYEKFREECQFEREYLKLDNYYKSINPKPNIYWDKNLPNKGEPTGGIGYKQSIDIINSYSTLLSCIIVFFALIAMVIILKKLIS